MKFLHCLASIFLLGCTSAQKPIHYTLEEQRSGTEALLIGISILDDNNVFISGTKSTFLKSSNGGATWNAFFHPEVDTFQFRDIHAFSESKIALLASGTGKNSQIHLFSAQEGWKTAFVMDNPEGFLNSIDFWDQNTGLAYGDSFDGKPYILKTTDGGNSWARIDSSLLPDAKEGEGGFASSGTCIEMAEGGVAWIGTGAGGSARVLKTEDYGKTWISAPTPIVKGQSAGITSIHFANEKQGFITGGDLSLSDIYTDNIAYTSDGGKSWMLGSKPVTKGAFYGSDYLDVDQHMVNIVCGPNGCDLSLNGGQTWENIAQDNLWVVDINENGIGWIAGQEGKILKIIISREKR